MYVPEWIVGCLYDLVIFFLVVLSVVFLDVFLDVFSNILFGCPCIHHMDVTFVPFGYLRKGPLTFLQYRQ